MDQTKKKVSIPLDDVLVVAIFYLFSMLLIGCCYRRIRSAGATEEMSLELNIFYVSLRKIHVTLCLKLSLLLTFNE
jgi:hypothetical protein